MENKIHQFGKFRYVEPNDFIEDRMFSNNNVSYNITHSYEDYCISVDLIVSIPDRNEGVVFGSNTYETTDDNNRRTTSFFGGKSFGGEEYYLSDTPGSIVYRDILNGDIDGFKENLGINSINISYNSYFYPEITINFTDVRGGALMMPSEENYRRDQINLGHKNKVNEIGIDYRPVYSKQVESFFSSLFSFPYPEFRLRVKGFYGKKIEFTLVISDFRSSFNNQTGNFDATVKFIGKMYGMYTDIPMSYLLIAPYCKYGSKQNKTIWEEKGYKFNNGQLMPTFLGLREKIASSNVNLKNKFTIEKVFAYQKSNNKKDLLLNIRNKYYELTSYISRTNKNNEVYIDDKSEKVILLKRNFNDSIIVANINNLVESITRYNDNFPNEKLSYPLPLEKTINKLTEIPTNEIYINSENSVYYFSWDEVGFNLNKLNTHQINVVKDYFNKHIKRTNLIDKSNTVYYNVIYLNDFITKLNNLIKNTTDEIQVLEEDLTNEGNNNITELLGFKPTIKNIFHMLMAHLNAFVELYSRFVANVTGINSRTLDDIKISLDQLPDIKKDTSSNKLLIPPFPAIKNIDKNQYCYPPSNVEMEETNFIASLFNSSFGLLEDVESSNKLIEQYYDESLKLIPTCLYDIGMYGNNKQINPYENIFTKNDDIGLLFTYFGIRCIIKYIIEREETYDSKNKSVIHYIDPELFGKLEAYNFWRVNKNLKKEIFCKFNTTNFTDNTFLSYLKNDRKAIDYYINNKPSYYTKNISSLIENKDGNILNLPSTFYFPCYFNDINEFLKNTNDNTGYISTFKENSAFSRPYKFLKFIDKSNIDNLQSQIESIPNLGNFCENADIILKGRINKNMYRFRNTELYRHNAILFRNKPSDGIYVKYSNFNKFEKSAKNEFNKLQNTYESEFKNDFNLETLCYFTDVNGKKREFFITESTTPEQFLSVINHDLYNIAESFKDKGRIIDMPYSTCLFIGMLMKKFKECKRSKDFEDFLKNTVYNRIREIDERKETHPEYKKYPQSLSTIFKTLMRSDSGDYGFYSQDEYEEMFYESNKKYYSKDILGLIKMYDDWCTSNAEGGWIYFKNNYKLSYALKNEKDIINDIFEELDEKFKEANDGGFNEIKIILNNYFTRSGEQDAFTDRYSTVYRIDEGGIDTDYVILGLNHDFSAYKSLNEFFKKSKKLLIPYSFQEDNVEKKVQYHGKLNDFKKAFNSFKSKLIELYGNNNLRENDKSIDIIYDVSEESKLSMYLTLKNLYDKHFCGLNKNKFDLDRENCEFNRFYFIDTFYNDLSDKLVFNLDIMVEILDILVGNYDNNVNTVLSSDMSLYSFMSLLCEKHNMMLLSLPVFNGDYSEIEKIFTPLPYNEQNNYDNGPSYICFYPHQPSQYLDNPSSQYSDDGFNIDNYDLNDTANFNGSTSIVDLSINDNGFVIPAFGVEYGSQKQSIFKDISVNMDNPQTTEVSIRNQFALANKNNEDARKLGFEGQDLFKIYSNYSYTCQVEMMGCAQIQPLMYFQLNNIPLFRGAYQIINVEHNIVPGNMSTRFKGVRISKTKIPLVDKCISINNMRNYLTKISTEELENSEVNYRDYILEPINSNSNYQMTLDLEISLQKIKSEFPDNIEFGSEEEANFNTLNPDLRKLIYSIVKDLNKMSTDEKKIGIYLTSSTRYATVNNNTGSDHLVNSDKASERRKILTDKNNNTYDKLGCAVDIIGTLNGNKDKGETSITIFNLIATNYHEYIRQLIWEINTLDSSQNNISNCIHLSSYGEYPTKNDKCQIYVSSSKTNPKFSGKTLGYQNLPSAFLKIKRNLQTMTDKIEFTNFPNNK